MTGKICVYTFVKVGLSHFNIRAARDLNAASSVSNHVVLHDLPVATETDAVATVFVDSITAKLCSAFLLHRNATAAIVQDAVGSQSGQLTALQHGHTGATVAVDEVRKHIQGLAALHVKTDCWRNAEGRLMRTLDEKQRTFLMFYPAQYLH